MSDQDFSIVMNCRRPRFEAWLTLFAWPLFVGAGLYALLSPESFGDGFADERGLVALMLVNLPLLPMRLLGAYLIVWFLWDWIDALASLRQKQKILTLSKQGLAVVVDGQCKRRLDWSEVRSAKLELKGSDAGLRFWTSFDDPKRYFGLARWIFRKRYLPKVAKKQIGADTSRVVSLVSRMIGDERFKITGSET